jgi:hypothetical protein
MRGELTVLSGIGVLGVIAVAAAVAAISADRAGSPSIIVVGISYMVQKAATLLVVLAPLLAGVVLASRTMLRDHPYAAGVLLLASLPILAMYVLFDILYWNNEYKFILAAAVCLTPFAAIAAARLLARSGRAALPLACAGALVFMSPALHRLWVDSARAVRSPRIDTSQFELRLQPDEPFAAMTDAISRLSPRRAVLVTRFTPFDWVTVTRRPSYVLFGDDDVHGLGMEPDLLLKRVRDYPAVLVDQRREAVLRLFDSDNDTTRAEAAARIMGDVSRPLVVILLAEDVRLRDWLASNPAAQSIHIGPVASAWLLAGIASVVDAAGRELVGGAAASMRQAQAAAP